jgi:hypothetical protein
MDASNSPANRGPLPPVFILVAVVLITALHLFVPAGQLFTVPRRFLGIVPVVAALVLNAWADRLFKPARTAIKPFGPSRSRVLRRPARVGPAGRARCRRQMHSARHVKVCKFSTCKVTCGSFRKKCARSPRTTSNDRAAVYTGPSDSIPVQLCPTCSVTACPYRLVYEFAPSVRRSSQGAPAKG